MSEINNCPDCGAVLTASAPAGLCPRCLMGAALPGSDPDALSPVDSPVPSNDPLAITTPQPRVFQAPTIDELAPHFPHLEIVGLLGQGGMGAVYQARQTKLDRMVALKVIRPESAKDPTFAERFMREARMLARLSHPNIVSVHDFGEIRGSSDAPLYYFLMEYVDGVNLRQMMLSAPLEADEALAIVPQICDALQYAHDEGIVHRDIKPENILIDRRGRVKIADFGLAKLAARSPEDFTLTATHQVMGTPRYMAPEQMAGSHQVDHRADIYSLGVVFYEMLTGEVPLGRFEPPSRRAVVDARLDDVVLRALASDPDQRYQRASELRTHLSVLHDADEQSVPAQAVSGPRFTGRELDGPRGLSTIIDDGIAGLVRRVSPGSMSKSLAHPNLPLLATILLGIAGVITIFVPWVHVIGAGRYIHAYDTISGSLIGVLFLLLTLGNLMDSGDPSEPQVRGTYTLVIGAIILFLLWLFKGFNVDWGPQFEPRLDGGFVVAFAFTIALMLIGAWDVRVGYSREKRQTPHRSRPDPQARLRARVEAQQDESDSSTSHKRLGAPTAHIGFTLPDAGDIGPRVIAHFSLLGYQLTEQRPGEWDFERGTRMAVLADFDIRRYHTTLTVRTGLQPEGRWVSCGWAVTTYGMAYISGKDIRTLETEGRDLEAALRRGAGITPGATPLGALAGEVHPGGTPSNPTLLQATAAGRRGAFDRIDEEQLALRAEIDGPSLAMIVLGLLMIVGHAIVLGLGLSRQIDRDTAWIGISGLIVGLAMFVGGLNLRMLWSHGWALIGALAGVVPVSPGWVLTLPVGIWAYYVLDRNRVRQAFIDSARQRAEDERLRTEPRFSKKAIVGVCWAPLMIFLPFAFQPTGGPNAFAWWQYPLMFTLGPLGALAPFATTILGWLAVHDIRHSRGRITGLGLALFDALAYPLLLLNGVIFMVLLVMFTGDVSTPSLRIAPALALTVLIGGVLSGYFVVWVLNRSTAEKPTDTERRDS